MSHSETHSELCCMSINSPQELDLVEVSCHLHALYGAALVDALIHDKPLNGEFETASMHLGYSFKTNVPVKNKHLNWNGTDLVSSYLHSSEIAALVWSYAYKLCSLTHRKSQPCAPNRRHLRAGRNTNVQYKIQPPPPRCCWSMISCGFKHDFIKTIFCINANKTPSPVQQWYTVLCRHVRPTDRTRLLLRSAVGDGGLYECMETEPSKSIVFSLTAPQQKQYHSRRPEHSPAAPVLSW